MAVVMAVVVVVVAVVVAVVAVAVVVTGRAACCCSDVLCSLMERSQVVRPDPAVVKYTFVDNEPILLIVVRMRSLTIHLTIRGQGINRYQSSDCSCDGKPHEYV